MTTRSSSINNSASKHTFKFASSPRFASSKQYANVSCYEVKSQFTTYKNAPTAGFSVASKRFGNIGVGKNDMKNYAPFGDAYYKTNFAGTIGKTVSNDLKDLKNTTKSYSFGVGRNEMKKIHVDEILRNRKAASPGPGAYARFSDFTGIESVETKAQSHNN